MLCQLLFLTSLYVQPVIFAPIKLNDQIQASESTKFDIGAAEAVFDCNEKTLVRTPSINPAYIRVEFKKPVSFNAIRLLVTEDVHEVSVQYAETLSDLNANKGTFLFQKKKTESGKVLFVLAKPLQVKALQLDVKRITGDDYVHIFEWQLCVPGKAEGLTIKRLTDRRDSEKATVVDSPLDVYVDTVIKFAGSAQVNGFGQDVTDGLQWKQLTTGVKPFGSSKGEFVVTKPGKQTILAQYGNEKKEIVLNGLERKVENKQFDIDVTYIERTPRIDFDGPNGGLPKVGSPVKWIGHVWNWSAIPVRFTYEWRVDGKSVLKGLSTAPVGGESSVAYPEMWVAKRRNLTLKVQPTVRMMEAVQANNELTIQTDAVTVGFWVERSLWDFMHEHQVQLPTKDANSFADWGQRMMRQWNRMFVEAVYKDYPQGVTERVHLDKITIVPDFALPLSGGIPSNNPDNRDKTVDMVWGMEGSDINPGIVVKKDDWWSPEKAIAALTNGDIEKRKIDPPFWCGLGYIHEMNHARYLVDSYGFNVHTDTGKDPTKWSIKVKADGQYVLGRYMPLKGDMMWSEKHVGHMGGDYWKFSAFETMCWNRVQGKRARGGNCNSPDTIGEFLNDIPKKVVLQFLDASGKPLNGAEVWVYRAHGTGNGWYTKVYEDDPAIRTNADDEGKVTFDRSLWSATGKIEHTFGISQSVALLRVTYQGRHYFLFECVADSNIAFNLGKKDQVVLVRQIELRTGEPKPEDWKATQTWEVSGGGYEKRPEGWTGFQR